MYSKHKPSSLKTYTTHLFSAFCFYIFCLLINYPISDQIQCNLPNHTMKEQNQANLGHYSESKEFWREPYNPPRVPPPTIPEPEQAVLEHILQSAPKEPRKVINSIDDFCEKHWLMHLGSEKVTLLEGALKQVKVKKVLDIGTYFGYSSLWFSLYFDAHVCSLDISEKFIHIAKQIHHHSGNEEKIDIHLGTVDQSLQYLKEKGPFDMVLLDHRKNYYVKDLETLSQQGLLTPNHWVIADNIFSPGCPEYFAFMKANPAYKSILYHSYNNTNDEADGVLISQHL